ncbi:MAG: HNH endonuclease [Alphaproteobacteria bacterium]
MPEQSDLEEKLKRWFPLVNGNRIMLPVQAAAVALSLKALVSDIESDGEGIREDALVNLDLLCTDLYQLSVWDKQGIVDIGLSKKQFSFVSKFPPEEVKQQDDDTILSWAQSFNNITSKGKGNFLRAAGRLLKATEGNFKNLSYSLDYVLKKNGYPEDIKKNVESRIKTIMLQLDHMNPPFLDAETKDDLVLQDGPKSSSDFLMCCAAYIMCRGYYSADADDLETMPSAPSIMKGQAVMDLVDHLYRINDDIKFEDAADELIRRVSNIDELFVNRIHGESLNMLGHYYLQHNQEKLRASDYASITSSLDQMLLADVMQDNSSYDPNLEQWNSLSVVKSKLYPDYPKPSPDEVFDNTMAAIEAYYDDVGRPDLAQEKQERFERMISETPEGMEDVVLLHYQENEEIRKIRKGAFRTQKEKFLKDLAVKYVDELIDAGFSDDDITRMREKGRLPSSSDWTVEHIVDRDHGGTNHWYNFSLMSDEINTQKDTLKKIQTYVQPDAGQGCWIRSWAPKKLPDGTYPKIVTKGPSQDVSLDVSLSL